MRLDREPASRGIVELVTAYLDDALEPAGRERFEEHLAFCEGCGGVAQLEVELGVSLETPRGRFACSTRNDNDEGRPGWISARS